MINYNHMLKNKKMTNHQANQIQIAEEEQSHR
jgi:hypothetical protein